MVGVLANKLLVTLFCVTARIFQGAKNVLSWTMAFLALTVSLPCHLVFVYVCLPSSKAMSDILGGEFVYTRTQTVAAFCCKGMCLFFAFVYLGIYSIVCFNTYFSAMNKDSRIVVQHDNQDIEVDLSPHQARIATIVDLVSFNTSLGCS